MLSWYVIRQVLSVAYQNVTVWAKTTSTLVYAQVTLGHITRPLEDVQAPALPQVVIMSL